LQRESTHPEHAEQIEARCPPGRTDGYDAGTKMNELIFIVEEAPEGGFTAQALGASIFAEADDWNELQSQVRDAVRCHFEEDERPKVVRLHYVREELLAT